MRPDQEPATDEEAERKSEFVLPVIVESVQVGRRMVDTGRGVRVHKHVTEHEEVIDEPLVQEELVVERIPIDQLVTGPRPEQRFEGQTLIVPVLEEVVVLEKKLRLKEEVRITRRAREVHAPQRVSLRSEEVTIERFDEEETGGRHG